MRFGKPAAGTELSSLKRRIPNRYKGMILERKQFNMDFFGRNKKRQTYEITVPKHVAIIMDGNGRWATRKGLNRKFGHAAGAQAFRNIVDYCIEIGIEYLTIYTLSTENFTKRPKEEIDAIMDLLDEYLDDCLNKLTSYNVRIKFIGDRTVFAPGLLKKMSEIESRTGHKKMILNIALNYGGRAEIVNAVNLIINNTAKNPLKKKIDEEEINKYLYTYGSPDPDLVIRTAGDQRLSNFLLWQTAYSELYFTDTLWPDFNKKSLDAAVLEYSKRKRRYGGL